MADLQLNSLTEQLRRGFSHERLASYHQAGDDVSLQLSRYAWNTALAEALYPALQSLEVALRNSIHVVLSDATGEQFWFERASLVKPQELQLVEGAKETLNKHRKPLESGRIIAELTFGFWTALFNDRYEEVLWPRFLKAVFPTMPRQLRTRINVSRRLNRIRFLRNRVFHHEPIWHWRDLPKQHEEIIETIGWLNTLALGMTVGQDRFRDIYQGGPQRYQSVVTALLARGSTP